MEVLRVGKDVQDGAQGHQQNHKPTAYPGIAESEGSMLIIESFDEHRVIGEAVVSGVSR